MIKFKKQKMPIGWHGQKHTVDAYVCKGLMVHKIPQEDGNAKFVWTISHVQTGYCVGLNYPPFRIMKEAKEMCAELLEDNDWLGDDLDEMFKILKVSWQRMYGLKYESRLVSERSSGENLPKREVRIIKCIICGGKPERYALGMDSKDKHGWYGWCLKCFPYDEKTYVVKGEMCRW